MSIDMTRVEPTNWRPETVIRCDGLKLGMILHEWKEVVAGQRIRQCDCHEDSEKLDEGQEEAKRE